MSIQAAGAVPDWTMADRLRKAREYAALEQGQLAQMIGASRTTIGNAERGANKPRRPLVIAWAMATGVDLTWLETGRAPAPDDPSPAPWPMRARRDSNPQPSDLEPRRLVAVAA